MKHKSYNHPREKRYNTNYRIKSLKVRAIDVDGTQLGVIDRDDAVKLARDKDCDLVEIVSSNPPVCRIMDFKKFLYEQKKKEKEVRKKQRQSQLKEIRLTPEISEHDYIFKKNHIEDFLKEGHKVRVTIIFKGRGFIHKDRGYQVLEKLTKEVSSIGKVDRAPRFQGRGLSVTVIPV